MGSAHGLLSSQVLISNHAVQSAFPHILHEVVAPVPDNNPVCIQQSALIRRLPLSSSKSVMETNTNTHVPPRQQPHMTSPSAFTLHVEMLEMLEMLGGSCDYSYYCYCYCFAYQHSRPSTTLWRGAPLLRHTTPRRTPFVR